MLPPSYQTTNLPNGLTIVMAFEQFYHNIFQSHSLEFYNYGIERNKKNLSSSTDTQHKVVFGLLD